MVLYADGTIVSIDDIVVDAGPNGRDTFCGTVIAMSEARNTITIAAICAANTLADRVKESPKGHARVAKGTNFCFDENFLGIYLEVGEAKDFKKLFGKFLRKPTKSDAVVTNVPKPKLVGLGV